MFYELGTEKMSAAKAILLGVGTLTWDGYERRSKRYGSVFLTDEQDNDTTPDPSCNLINNETALQLAGFYGKLVVKILRTRKSTHVGDIARDIYPRIPTVGSELILGEGFFFVGRARDGSVAVGVRPTEERQKDWMDPRALYDTHEQTVELKFQPT